MMDMIEYAGLGVEMGNYPDYLRDAMGHVLEKFILN
jgi:hydroxymethylpyrimidine pyrophosphatase-like HAD family hydrolase